MSLHFNAFSVVLLMSGVSALLVALVLFQRRHTSIFWFSLMMMASAVWAIAYSFELSSQTLKQMLFWIDFEYIGISLLPALWIMFIVHFIGKKQWLTSRNTFLIFIFPVIAMLLVWTNQYHHIHYRSTALDDRGDFPLLTIEPGVWYHIHTVYFYFLLALGMFLLIQHFRRSEKIYRSQTAIVLAGVLVPWITNFLYLVGLRPHEHIDMTPYAFILTSIIIAFGLTRYKLFDVVPFAREKLLETIREGMLVLDNQGRVIDYNTTVQKFLKGYATSLVGMRLQEIFPTHYSIQHLLLRERSGREEIKLQDDRVYEVSSTPLQDDLHQYQGTLLVFWDITNRKKTTEKLKRQKAELQELNDLKNQMFSIIAHDLKSPMASLMGILKLAEANTFNEAELKNILSLLVKNVDNTKILLDNLLIWSRSQLQGEQIHSQLFDLKKVNTRTVSLFEKRISEKGIRLVDEISSETMIYADRNMIDLVVRNLVGNAIKFCDTNDVITLQASIQAGHTTVRVIDTGMGMDESAKATLFELGISRGAGTRNEMGTGLGLKLCKDFIEKNHGTIWAESEAGKGSIFSFRLPNEAP